jgi:hypothetical protein
MSLERPMPVVAALAGAVLTGLFYWLIWGRGLDYLELRWRESRDRKRDTARRAAALEAQRSVPLRSIADPRDAATVLMALVARQRGVPTPEQSALIALEMRQILELDREVPHRLAFAMFAAEQAAVPDEAVAALAPLLRDKLTPSEREDLLGMLQRVAELHGGATDGQERLIAHIGHAVVRAA